MSPFLTPINLTYYLSELFDKLSSTIDAFCAGVNLLELLAAFTCCGAGVSTAGIETGNAFFAVDIALSSVELLNAKVILSANAQMNVVMFFMALYIYKSCVCLILTL